MERGRGSADSVFPAEEQGEAGTRRGKHRPMGCRGQSPQTPQPRR